MDPIPETSEAIDEFGPFHGTEGDLLERLMEMGRRIREVVPECVGLSLASRTLGVTFTLVASAEEIAALDGLQYLDGGPCVTAVDEQRVVSFHGEDVLGEEGWQLFARGTAASGVASTLTLPLRIADEVTGSINLYAATTEAFAGKHEELADLVGGWAPGAVANADLSFATRRTAQDAPRLLVEEMRIQVAVGILMASLGMGVNRARAHLETAASQAGVSQTVMAKILIAQATYVDQSDGPDPDAPDDISFE